VGAENIMPVEVEDALALFDGVKTSAVVAVPHEVWGEAVFAWVTMQHEQTGGLTGAKLVAALRRHMQVGT
jgi:long-chain acyl-CoA synthetase